jgi:hypothetical protein
MTSGCGFVYIAMGEDYVQEAAQSAESLRRNTATANIALITDSNSKNPKVFDDSIEIENPRFNFGDQVYYIDKSPYEKTICLDTDIRFDAPVNDIFEALNEFKLCVAHNLTNYTSDRIDLPIINQIPDCFPEMNTGVIGYSNCDAVKSFFSTWRRIYAQVSEAGQIHNQAAFRAALYKSDIRFSILPREYNCLFRRAGCVTGEVKIFHGRLIEIDGPGAKKTVDVEAAADVINRYKRLRVYYNVGNETKIVDPSPIIKMIYSMKNRGLINTIRRSMTKLNHWIS